MILVEAAAVVVVGGGAHGSMGGIITARFDRLVCLCGVRGGGGGGAFMDRVSKYLSWSGRLVVDTRQLKCFSFHKTNGVNKWTFVSKMRKKK